MSFVHEILSLIYSFLPRICTTNVLSNSSLLSFIVQLYLMARCKLFH